MDSSRIDAVPSAQELKLAENCDTIVRPVDLLFEFIPINSLPDNSLNQYNNELSIRLSELTDKYYINTIYNSFPENKILCKYFVTENKIIKEGQDCERIDNDFPEISAALTNYNELYRIFPIYKIIRRSMSVYTPQSLTLSANQDQAGKISKKTSLQIGDQFCKVETIPGLTTKPCSCSNYSEREIDTCTYALKIGEKLFDNETFDNADQLKTYYFDQRNESPLKGSIGVVEIIDKISTGKYKKSNYDEAKIAELNGLLGEDTTFINNQKIVGSLQRFNGFAIGLKTINEEKSKQREILQPKRKLLNAQCTENQCKCSFKGLPDLVFKDRKIVPKLIGGESEAKQGQA